MHLSHNPSENSVKLTKSMKQSIPHQQQSSTPCGRKDHNVSVFKKSSKILLYGGINLRKQIKSREAMDELWMLDSSWRWNKLETSSNINNSPGPLKGHSLNIIENQIYVFGGINPFNHFSSSLWIFDYKVSLKGILNLF